MRQSAQKEFVKIVNFGNTYHDNIDIITIVKTPNTFLHAGGITSCENFVIPHNKMNTFSEKDSL